jgi:hypothetical protein
MREQQRGNKGQGALVIKLRFKSSRLRIGGPPQYGNRAYSIALEHQHISKL